MPRGGVARLSAIAGNSFLRRVDPRTKIALSLAASATVALPLLPLALVAACFGGLLVAAKLARPAAAQLWRMRLWLTILFLLDCCVVGLGFAVLIALRLVLLSAAFILVFATTTPDELRLASEWLGMPPRLAFAFSTAFRSLGLLEREWDGILEAQKARGVGMRPTRSGGRTARWHLRRDDLTSAAALVVPAIVLATQRAWAISEAAAARGFGSPVRHPYHGLQLRVLDHALLIGTAAVLGGSFLLR
jgi:energy-coupling factor transporter transmembrane protein EcfT